MVGPVDLEEQSLYNIRYFFKNRNYHEIISYTFIDPKDQELFDPDNKPLKLSNPIAENMSVMRTNLWGGLVNTLIYNVNHQQSSVRLFETGLRFLNVFNKLEQQEVVAGLIYGEVGKRQWNEQSRFNDFFDLKGDLQALLGTVFRYQEFDFRAAFHPVLHPGQTAAIYKKDSLVGFVGALHPIVAYKKGLYKPIYLFELITDLLFCKRQSNKLKTISKFPLIHRDIAIIIKRDVKAEEVINVVKRVSGSLLLDVGVFDIYEGKEIQSGKKGIALNITLHKISHALNEKEISDTMSRVCEELVSSFNATLRK